MSSQPAWYKNAIFYEIYVRAYHDGDGDGHGDLRGLIEKLDYLKGLGVDCLWLMPIYPSPLLDDGYDIADFYSIHPDYGSLDDFRELIAAVHARQMRLITDLVLNHTSDQHPWFQSARSTPKSPYRDYYVWSDSNQKFQDARVIFLDTEPSNWTWDDQGGQFYWHRFYACQPDLNYTNPAVQREMIEVVKFWLDLGVDGFRADAVPYLFEREGTNCENLPETHLYLKGLRAFINEHYPDRILLCEANQWPQDVRPYFGDGDEFHMGFHFPLMPRVFMALRKEEISPLVWVMEHTPPIPDACQWCTFLRNHDELTLEMVSEEERQWMWEQFAPEPRMRLNLGIRRRLAPLLDNDQRKIALAYSLLFTFPGAPIIYYGDEIGMGDEIWLPDRNGVRTPMQWDTSQNGGFSNVNPKDLFSPVTCDPVYSPQSVNVADQIDDQTSLFHIVHQMILLRKSIPAFGWGTFSWVNSQPDTTKDAVAAYWRELKEQKILVVNNLAADHQEIHIRMPSSGTYQFQNLLDPVKTLLANEGYLVSALAPYQYQWLLMQQ
jgi:maltose alpha-D-glucosyltransferase/alpha-amylase